MASVFCNGQFVGEHRGGFSAFTMDLTPYLHSGENELTVKVDNHADLPVYPAQADFTFFGGLYRQVELLIFADKAHFNVTEYGADSLLLTPDVETGTVQASVLCDGGDRLTLTVKDPNGTVVAQEETSVTGQKTTLCLTVSDVQLWGHRRDVKGYAQELEKFDVKLGELLGELKEDDLLIITADHGNDPTHTGTDHTREKVPFLAYSPSMKEAGELEEADTFAIIGATIADNFGVKMPEGTIGHSILDKLN